MAALDRIIEQLRADGRWRRWLQIGLVLAGTALVSASGIGIGVLPAWKFAFGAIGLIGVAMTVLGGIFLGAVDVSKPDLMADLLQDERAAKMAAAESADHVRRLKQDMLALGEELTFQTDLRSLGDAMLETVEQALAAERPLSQGRRNATIAKLVDFLKAKRMSLLGFEDEYWTLSIYLMENDASLLKCLVARRPNEDDERLVHREWAPGEGHIGKAFQDRKELVTSDAQDLSQAQFLQAPPEKRRPYDTERFRSIASVPIVTGKTEAVGGVTATSDRVGRFMPGSEGPDRVAALRVLALSIAVLISAAEQEVVDVR